MANRFTRLFWKDKDPVQPVDETEQRSVTTGGVEDAVDFLLKKYGLSGISSHVSGKNAMGLATFFGCVRFISNVLASLPFSVHVWEEGKGTRKDRKHPLQWVLGTRFNQNMVPFVARRSMIANAIVWGWSISEVIRNRDREVIAIKPYATKDVNILHDELTDQYFFTIQPDGRTLSQDDVIFLKDLSFVGGEGNSIINWQSQVIKTALLTKNFINAYYENGTFISGILIAPNANTEEKAKAAKTAFVEGAKGDGGGGPGVAVLTNGATFQQIGATAVEAQVAEISKMSDSDICKMFGVPLSMIGDTSNQSAWGNGVEDMFIGVTNTVLIPVAVQVEQEVDYKCFRRDEIQTGYFTKHNFKGLLRGNMTAQAEHDTKMVNSGIYMPDEVRDFDEMAPLPKETGSRAYMNGTMTPLDLIDEVKKGGFNQKQNVQEDTSAGDQ